MTTQNPSPATGDHTEDFKNVMRDFGITPPDCLIGDGNLHRFHIEGDKGGSINGWYKLHLDGRAAGSFGSWKHGINECWKAGGEFRRLTQAEKQAFAIEKQRQAGSRYFCESLFWASQPKQAAKITRPLMPAAPQPS